MSSVGSLQTNRRAEGDDQRLAVFLDGFQHRGAGDVIVLLQRPEDRGVFQLQSDVPAEVQEGDFMWLRAFCHKPATPAARVDSATCFKDVNRHASLSRQFAS